MTYTITGNNFSGRSKYLHTLKHGDIPVSYLNVIPNSFLSGLATTVRQELELHANLPISNISDLISSLGFSDFFTKNPFELSGGQQVICATLNMILLNYPINIIDCSLEQLSHKTRSIFLDFFEKKFDANKNLYIADNRLKEFADDLVNSTSIDMKDSTDSPKLSQFIDSNIFEQEHFALTLDDLHFNYKEERVLKGVSGTFNSGCIYLLDGENGAGKSTLAKLLVGVIKPSSGLMLLNGNKFEPYFTPGKVVGYSFQNPKEQIFENSVSSEILSGVINKNYNNKLLKEVGFSFGFSKLVDCNPFELPFVLQKRLAIASSIAMNRPFLILDEPTIGQDDINSLVLIELIKQLSNKGVCIIIISHSSWFRRQIEYKKVELKGGRLFF